MCEGPCTGRSDCPMMQLPQSLPLEESCGAEPAVIFPNTMKMLREMGDFLPPINRALKGQLIETT